MAQGNVDVLTLRAKGKARLSEKGGVVSLRTDDPVGALQAIAHQAKLKIDLTPDDVECLAQAGKVPISLDYPATASGASEAARGVFDLARAAQASSSRKSRAGPGKLVGFVGLLALVGALAFMLAYKILERIYG